MKAALFDPYLDTLGGGERYLVGMAQVLEDLGFDVFLNWKDKGVIEKLEKRFGVELERTFVVENIRRGFGFDLCFWFSDGSIPLLLAKKNFLHFQVPFKNVDGKNIKNRIKLLNIDKVVVNSFFTKRVIDGEFGVSGEVVYPPVDVDSFLKRRVNKENIIIFVGRFSQLKQAKRQDVLIEVFKDMVDRGFFKEWKLILAGGVEIGSSIYLKDLKKASSGYPIEFLESPSFDKLVDAYLRSKIFWSASGFGVDEDKSPDKVEHFGITLVEAMASRVFPIAFAAGGHKEIIENGKNGFLWKEKDELIDLTLLAIDKKLYLKKENDLIERSRLFSYKSFSDKIKNLLNFV